MGEYFRAYRHRGLVSEERGALHAGKGGVFALHEAFQGRVVGVSEPHVVQFPRLAAAKPRREAVCSPNCRHIEQRTLKIGHFEAMGLNFGGIGVYKRVG